MMSRSNSHSMLKEKNRPMRGHGYIRKQCFVNLLAMSSLKLFHFVCVDNTRLSKQLNIIKLILKII